jgi:hypothetical protein
VGTSQIDLAGLITSFREAQPSPCYIASFSSIFFPLSPNSQTTFRRAYTHTSTLAIVIPGVSLGRRPRWFPLFAFVHSHSFGPEATPCLSVRSFKYICKHPALAVTTSCQLAWFDSQVPAQLKLSNVSASPKSTGAFLQKHKPDYARSVSNHNGPVLAPKLQVTGHSVHETIRLTPAPELVCNLSYRTLD